ncbi:hypothetical protein NQ314_006931 [Rhamnusium bicolor]|uniref:MADF domain-containing protein n=1 Tax=Rhamnusium bicolor TaxID=1586634 RepID=A0AAV8YTS8_9CUCU|nr:hypothetical protein NQ314_006931 [Rhamnusium bicolor]
MVYRWIQDLILEFIELCRAKEILWDTTNSRYYNNIKKNNAWDEIASELGIPSEECKKIIEAILAALRRENQKIKKICGTSSGKYTYIRQIVVLS